MNFSSRRREKDLQREERRVLREEREKTAGKLLAKAPDLTSLSISIREARPEGCVSDTQYTRRIVLEHAAALFEVPCAYPSCEDGGYDVTREVLLAIAAKQEHFEGQQACRGRCGSLDCTRILHYVGKATYRDSRTAGPSDSKQVATTSR